MKNRLLILGSMDEFIALVKKAKARGIYTIVCDGYTEGPAKKYADKAYDIDIRQVEKIVELCKTEKVDGIIASFSDILFEYLVKIGTKAGLKTYCTPEKSVLLREKSEMKKMFSELGIPMAKSVQLHKGFDKEKLNEFPFPAVMKPINGYGSRGIYVVENVGQVELLFDKTANYSTFQEDIILESYNDGYEFNMMNWIVDGEVFTLGLADREKSVEIKGDIPHVCRIVYPSRIIDCVYEEAREIVRKVAEYTGIKTGPISMQFFYKPGKGIEVCECAGRLFGYEHELVTYGSGFDIEELLLDYVYDEESMKNRLEKHDAHYKKRVAGLYFHGHEGKVEDLTVAESVIRETNPLESIIYYNKGDIINHGVGAKPYLIRMYIEEENYEKLDELTRKLYEKIRVYDKNGKNMVYHNELMEYKK